MFYFPKITKRASSEGTSSLFNRGLAAKAQSCPLISIDLHSSECAELDFPPLPYPFISVVLNQENNKLYLSPMRLERKGCILGFWKLMLQNEDANKTAGTNIVKLPQLVYSCIND
jgi:hypothetical protein